MNIKELLQKYIDLNLETDIIRCRTFKSAFYECDMCSANVDDFIKEQQDESKFQKLLFRYIDSKKLKDSDVYNKAGIDRRLFSKIRNDQDYHPSKETIILLSLSLELNEDEMLSLLNSASYTLPKNNINDLIIRFCFINKIYDINKVNELLYDYNCKTLN